MKRLFAIATILYFATTVSAQEALKSTEEEYYDFLSLTGKAERPTLGYRTLSDSEWIVSDENHVWSENNLGTKYSLYKSENPTDNFLMRGVDQSVKVKIYGPEWFNSYNTAAPYGQNDGALWQGKGYNTSLTAGARLEAYGLELTFKPQLSYSQNKEFELMTSVVSSPYGYYQSGIDAPQRFGDEAIKTFDFGDSEIRYTWHTLTVGAGFQSPWLGPAWLNPMLGSNNAPSYPKIDAGLRKTEIYMPFFGWDLGAIEGRVWLGRLEESEYFDEYNSNNHNRINGFSFSYAPSFLEGFSLGFTKVCISKWNSFEAKYLNPFYDENSGVGTSVGEDQKFSAYIDWIVPKGCIEVYGEVAIDDYLQGGWITGLIRYPFDTLIWTMGLKKNVPINSEKNIYGEIILEFSDMEQPRDRISGKESYFFNSHSQITQGYTNKGQYLGTALANGGNAQSLIFDVYYPKGKAELLLQRANPDDTYSYVNLYNNNQTYKGYALIGLSNSYFVLPQLQLDAGILYQRIINSLYFDKDNNLLGTKTLDNICFTFGCKYNFKK